ncbi:MAG: prepilin-type N-terminal cleavage/methylation domain-containing protein [Gammaproteobacteria bacterium]|nr:prepilin-type N-terminal cleavage/methylation domain-containing protein [Gammaproteobacteria bacterium]
MNPYLKNTSARSLQLPAHRRQAGFTLIETIIVIVLVGAMMAGMTTLFMNNVGNSHRPYLRQKALSVANAFMDEIQRKRWNEATPLGGGCVNTGASCPAGPAVVAIGSDGDTRATYDDIDDYHGLNQRPPQDSSATNMPDYSGYTVSVSVVQPATSWNGVPAADVRLITVSVTSPGNETISLSTYRVNI